MNLTNVNPYRKSKGLGRRRVTTLKPFPPHRFVDGHARNFLFPSTSLRIRSRAKYLAIRKATAAATCKGGHWLILTKQDILKIFSRYFLGFFIKWPNYPLLQPPNTSPPNLNPISSLDEEEGILDIEYITFILFFFKKGKMGSWRVSVREYKTSHLIINFQLF